jgi:hypothetical protein
VLQIVRRRASERLVWAIALVTLVVLFRIIAGQRLVFGRYLLPLLPAACVLAGGLVGWVAAWPSLVGGRTWVRWATVAALLAAAGSVTSWQSFGFVARIGRTSTPALAYAWIAEHVPPGTPIAIETRELLLPADAYPSSNEPRLIVRTAEDYARNGVAYLVASSQAYGEALSGATDSREAVLYRELTARLELVAAFRPSDEHPGPELRIYRVPDELGP